MDIDTEATVCGCGILAVCIKAAELLRSSGWTMSTVATLNRPTNRQVGRGELRLAVFVSAVMGVCDETPSLDVLYRGGKG